MPTKKLICFVMGLVLVVASSFMFPAMGAEEKIKIGFAHVNMNCPYYVAMQKTAEEVAKEEGVELIWYNAEDNEQKQIRQVMSMIAQGIDGLLINPVTPEGVKRAIKACVKENIPVVAIDRQLYGDYIAYEVELYTPQEEIL